MTVTEPTDGDPVVVTVDPATTGAAFSRYQGGAEEEPIVSRWASPPIDAVGDSWRRLAEWIAAAELAPGDDRWEVYLYLTEPSPEMDPNELRTALNWTIR